MDHHTKLKMGDHIYILIAQPIYYEHHGIYIGEGKVIHFCNSIVKSSLESFSHGKVVRKAPNMYSHFNSIIKQRYPRKEVVKRALSKLGTGKYNLLEYNGEHFASWCKCGTYCSSMIKEYDLRSFLFYVPGFDTMAMTV